MLKRYKYRLMPTNEQAILINKHIGGCRFIYNIALETKQFAYSGNKINLDFFDLCKQLTDLKKEYLWLKEINAQSLQQSIKHLNNAFINFYNGKRDFPKFKKKNSKQSFNIPQKIKISNGKLIIPKFTEGISIIKHRIFLGEIRQATVSKARTGKYFVSLLIEDNIEYPSKCKIIEEATVGIDLGLKTFLVSSDGGSFNNPRFLKKSLSKLKYIQLKYSNKNGKRTKYKLALLHEKITNQRKDFLNKTSSELIKNHDTICIEKLNIKGMLKNGNLAQSIGDVGWGEFIRQLEYKAQWNGKNIIQIGRFEPSSKMCSNCGNINKDLKLKTREWSCSKCNSLHDRDLNAAINIKNIALKSNTCMGYTLKNQNELPTLVGVMTSET